MIDRVSKLKLLLLVLSMIGCTKVNTVEKISATAWSDDSTQIVFYEARYDEKHSFPGGMQLENFQYRLGFIDRNGGSKHYFTDYFRRAGNEYYTFLNLNFKELQFKSNAGFVIARVGDSGHFLENNRIFTDDIDYIVYDLDGNILYTATKDSSQFCGGTASPDFDTIRVLASPSGQLIVKVTTTFTCELEVSFLDPRDSFKQLETNQVQGKYIDGLLWVNDDNLLIHICSFSNCTVNWVLVRPGQAGSISITDDEFLNLCLFGTIFRTDINSEGELIKWDTPNSDISIEKASLEDYSDSEITSLNNKTGRLPDNPNGCITIESFM